MKRATAMIIALLLMAGALSGCGSEGESRPADGEKKTKSIVATIFPQYDWVRNILGDNPAGIELTLFLDKGVDLHSFQPTADDILALSDCDLFIYVGGESDAWVDKALAEAGNPEVRTVNLLEALGDGAREEEVVEGMQEEDEDDEEEDGPEYDEHVWLSLRNAQKLVEVIADAVAETDAENAALYRKNAEAYNGKLADLDARYARAVEQSSAKTLLFGDRFPFRYMTEDYGLDYYAAFVGCSAETEASFETIAFLAGKVDELGLSCVMTIEGSDHRIAETIIANTASKDQQILTMDSLQSVTGAAVEEGADYLAMMEKNLTVLEEALKGGTK